MSLQQGQRIVKEGPEAQGQQHGELRTKAWLNEKWYGQQPKDGTLELREGRVRFVTNGGEKVFDSPLGEVKGEFPIYYAGAGAKLSVAGRRYYVYFFPPFSRSSIALVKGIMAAKPWKPLLTQG
jgi:hypothetical protein